MSTSLGRSISASRRNKNMNLDDLGALVGLGIDPARLSSKGFGPDKPIAENNNESSRAKNRRVELVKM